MGVRYTKDKRDLTAYVYNSVACLSLGVSLASIGGADNCTRNMSAKFNKLSYTAGLEYRARHGLLFYVKTNRGYRAGGLQSASGATTPVVADFSNQPFGSKTVDDVELGMKAQFLDNRLRTNVAVYRSWVKNAIRTVAAPVPGTATFASFAQNAVSAKIDGVEFDITARPVPEIELSANGSYIDARFSKYITPAGENRTALPLLFTPKWQNGVSAAYILTLDGAVWRNQVDYSWTGRQLTAETGAYSEKYGLLNFRSSVKIEQYDLDVAVFRKNLTDRRYTPYPLDLRVFGFINNQFYNTPRTFGVELTKNF